LYYLTSLRGIAAFLVLLYHLKHNFQPGNNPLLYGLISNGYLAVDFFFILSGFFLTYKYGTEFLDFSLKRYRYFIGKRIARIYPLHLFMLLNFATIPTVLFLTGRTVDSHRYSINALFTKIILVDVWWTGNEFTWNVPSWSISAEFLAYLFFPVLVFFIGRIRPSLLVPVAFIIALILAELFYITGLETIGDDIGKLGIVRCLFEFSIGIMLCFRVNICPPTSENKARLVFLLAIATLVFSGYLNIKNYIYMPLCFAGIIYGLLGYRGYIHQILEHRMLVYLGDISYSVYLTHYFVRDVLVMVFLKNNEIAGTVWITSYIILTLIVSSVTYNYIEMPARKWLVGKLIM
jgi:peptidoglycan/LPS O-acetylase OafA/YrhL